MSDSSQLLRMLDPSVRPTGTPAPRVQPKQPVDGASFDQLLERAATDPSSGGSRELKLSAHARQRLAERGVELGDSQMQALAAAADRAEAKGANESLMLMDRLGLIVNIPNRTVKTVLPADRMRDGVVTNIDSTVIVDDAAATNSPTHRLEL